MFAKEPPKLTRFLGKGGAEAPESRAFELLIQPSFGPALHQLYTHPHRQETTEREVKVGMLRGPQKPSCSPGFKILRRRTDVKWRARRRSKGAKEVGESLQAHL